MSTTTEALRLPLTRSEVRAAQSLGVPFPPDLAIPEDGPRDLASLEARGLATDDTPGDILTLFAQVAASAMALVRIDVNDAAGFSFGTYLVADESAASCLGTKDGIELSLFSPLYLGAELTRAVPPVEKRAPLLNLDQPTTTTTTTGRFPYAVIDPEAPLLGTTPPRLTAAERAAVSALSRMTGSLVATVLRPGGTTYGEVVWVRTRSGYLSVTPELVDGVRYVVTDEVQPSDIGSCLSPFIASIVAGGTP